MSFENKVLRILRRPLYDELGCWHRRKKQRNPISEWSPGDNSFCESTKNQVVWTLNEGIRRRGFKSIGRVEVNRKGTKRTMDGLTWDWTRLGEI